MERAARRANLGDRFGYSTHKFPEEGISLNQAGSFDWEQDYAHEFRVIKGEIKQVFIRDYARGYRGPCFTFSGSLKSGMGGGPVIDLNRGVVFGVNSATAFHENTSLGSLLYPYVLNQITFGANLAPNFRINSAQNIIQMLEFGSILSDGGSGRMVGWLVANAIAPHVPVRESANKGEGIIPESAFSFDPECDDYTCPEGKRLISTGHVNNRRLSHRASKFDCEKCPFKPNCCPTQPYRKLTRDVDEAARDVARALVGTEAFEHSRRLRKKVEVRFAHLKTIVGLRRLRLRGLSGAGDEMTLAATAQNLRKLARSNITARKRAA